VAGSLFNVFVFWRARKIREKHTNFVEAADYAPVFRDIIADETIPRTATNLVYLAMTNDATKIDSNIIYSVFKKQPKRADIYWILHIEITDAPNTKKYKVVPIVEGKVFFVQLKFGFKVKTKVNKMFKQITQKMQESGEVDEQSHYPSLRRYDLPADFKFILLNSRVSADDALPPFEQFIVRAYRILKNIAASPAQSFGLENGNFLIETVPINVAKAQDIDLVREDV
jgi:KUP system potassium uptake protein